jgi:hypothetical protein
MGSNDNSPPKKGLKINNQRSSVPQPKVNNTAVFNEQAKEVFLQYEDYKQRTWELSTRFKSMIEDKTLSENRTIISKDLEKEVLDKLVALSSEMNSDDNQPEGIGSIALSMLILKMLLLQRDTINSLAYKVDRLEKNNSKLENTVKTLLEDKKE